MAKQTLLKTEHSKLLEAFTGNGKIVTVQKEDGSVVRATPAKLARDARMSEAHAVALAQVGTVIASSDFLTGKLFIGTITKVTKKDKVLTTRAGNVLRLTHEAGDPYDFATWDANLAAQMADAAQGLQPAPEIIP